MTEVSHIFIYLYHCIQIHYICFESLAHLFKRLLSSNKTSSSTTLSVLLEKI